MQKTLPRLTLTRFRLYTERLWILLTIAWYRSEIARLDHLIVELEKSL
jgi:hypothetical protein